MSTFRYQAIEPKGSRVDGRLDAPDRRAALQILSDRGLYPSLLEVESKAASSATPVSTPTASNASVAPVSRSLRFGRGIRRKEITAFTREMAALLEVGVPIPQALASIAEEESNLVLREVLVGISDGVRRGLAFSDALREHPQLFDVLYCSMIRVGEEAGALPQVMQDLSALLEHEDEVRSEVSTAVAYPLFVLAFGFLTVTVLLTVVLPRLFSMLEEMLDVLPLPTLILLNVSGFIQSHWYWMLPLLGGACVAVVRYFKTPKGSYQWDVIKLRAPVIGGVFRSSAMSRFARTLGILAKSGVSLLPSLKIVEHTVGNQVLAGVIAKVAEETRGGDSLAGPLRKLGAFPGTIVQMISVGEESGKLDVMLLKAADMEERHMRAKTKTLVSLLAPALILVVGAVVGFMVIALLLPIFKMSQSLH